MNQLQMQVDMINSQKQQEHVDYKPKVSRKVDLDEISQKIAIVRSNGCQGRQMLKLIEEIKKDIEYGKVNKDQEKYWKDIKEAGENVIQEWEETHAEVIRQCQRDYLEAKLGKMSMK